MAKKKTEKKEKNVTMDELAIMVNSGFESMKDEMNSRFEKVDERLDNLEGTVDNLKHEVHYGFKNVEASFGRISRRIDNNEDIVIEIKNRVKVIEKKLGIPSPR